MSANRNGHIPSPELMLLAGMLAAPAAAVRAVLRYLAPGDLEQLGAPELLATIADLIQRGQPHDGVAVGDELQRLGLFAAPAGAALNKLFLDALTPRTPPLPDALRAHAAAVVAAAHRRHVRLAGEELVELADTAPEDDLLPRMRELGTETARRAKRLAALRGEHAQETAA